jgi:hypothetical protein
LIIADVHFASPAGLATAALAQDVKTKNELKPATPGVRVDSPAYYPIWSTVSLWASNPDVEP